MTDLDLIPRLRAAADAIQELSAMAGYKNPYYVAWTADLLRREADVLEKDVPA